jgi:hypothetical protein
LFFLVFFFFPGNLFLIYFFFEISLFPIVIMVLGFGNQIEKVGAAYYLFFYSFFCSVPFILILFNLDYFFFFLYFDSFFCWEVFFFSLFVFLDEISCVFFTFLVTKGACGGAHEGEDNFGGVVVKARNWGVCSSFVSSAGKVLFFFFFCLF